jgi:hypothetical protein
MSMLFLRNDVPACDRVSWLGNPLAMSNGARHREASVPRELALFFTTAKSGRIVITIFPYKC